MPSIPKLALLIKNDSLSFILTIGNFLIYLSNSINPSFSMSLKKSFPVPSAEYNTLASKGYFLYLFAK